MKTFMCAMAMCMAACGASNLAVQEAATATLAAQLQACVANADSGAAADACKNAVVAGACGDAGVLNGNCPGQQDAGDAGGGQ